jgi:hypothetical protein
MATVKRTPAKKTVAKKSAAKTASNKTAANKTAHRSSAKKSTTPAKKTNVCWPGFEPVPGKQPMTEGSCRPKPHQTSAEKKADSRAAAGSKLQKAGGEKAKANRN